LRQARLPLSGRRAILNADQINVRQTVTKLRYVPPVLLFWTSLGALAFQFVAFGVLIYLAGRYPGLNRNHPAIFKTTGAVWSMIPLVSIVGLVCAVFNIRKKERIAISVVGLVLNCAYFSLFLYLANAGQDARFWAS
jgi:hypothetical protein